MMIFTHSLSCEHGIFVKVKGISIHCFLHTKHLFKKVNIYIRFWYVYYYKKSCFNKITCGKTKYILAKCLFLNFQFNFNVKMFDVTFLTNFLLLLFCKSLKFCKLSAMWNNWRILKIGHKQHVSKLLSLTSYNFNPGKIVYHLTLEAISGLAFSSVLLKLIYIFVKLKCHKNFKISLCVLHCVCSVISSFISCD